MGHPGLGGEAWVGAREERVGGRDGGVGGWAAG